MRCLCSNSDLVIPKPAVFPSHSLIDIWVVFKQGLPAGIIEVKTPGHAVFDSKYIAGQMLDYMLRLQTFHGLQWVFGKPILSACSATQPPPLHKKNKQ